MGNSRDPVKIAQRARPWRAYLYMHTFLQLKEITEETPDDTRRVHRTVAVRTDACPQEGFGTYDDGKTP
jgi:hypothetical protein